MTNEIAGCVKMKRKSCRIESLAPAPEDWRSIVSVITSAAEKKRETEANAR
jgi:hypothetical protein